MGLLLGAQYPDFPVLGAQGVSLLPLGVIHLKSWCCLMKSSC